MGQNNCVEIQRIINPLTDLDIKLCAEVAFNNTDLIVPDRFNEMISKVVKYVDLYQIHKIDVITRTCGIDVNDVPMIMNRGERILYGILELGAHAKEVNVFISHIDQLTFLFVRKRLEGCSTIKVHLS